MGEDADRLLQTVADGVLLAAWPQLADPAVLDGVGEIVLKRADANGDLPDRGDEQAFREKEGRRRLVARVVEKHGTDVQRLLALTFTSPPMVTPADTLWLLERTEHARGSAQEATWAALAARVFLPQLHEVTAMFALVEKSKVCRAAFDWWLTSVSLDSDTAKRAAQRAIRRRSAEPVHDPQRIDREIVRHLAAFEAGDVDGWWHVNVALASDPPDDELQADLTLLPAWTRVAKDIRDRIIAGARPYLERQDPDPERWFGTNRLDRRAFAAYRALHLLAACRPEALDELADATWERWMPIVVHYPRSSGIGDPGAHAVVVAMAASRHPDAMVEWVLRAIDAQNGKGDGHLFVLSRLRGVRAPELDGALAAKIQDPLLKAAARADLVAHVLSTDVVVGLAAAAPYLSVSAAAADRETAAAVGSAAMRLVPGATWQLLEPLFTADPAIGVSIIENLAHGEHADLGAQLDDEALSRLINWMFAHLPPEDDPPQQPGAHWVARASR